MSTSNPWKTPDSGQNEFDPRVRSCELRQTRRVLADLPDIFCAQSLLSRFGGREGLQLVLSSPPKWSSRASSLISQRMRVSPSFPQNMTTSRLKIYLASGSGNVSSLPRRPAGKTRSGNRPGIQREASVAGNTRRSGARTPSAVRMPRSVSAETMRRAWRSSRPPQLRSPRAAILHGREWLREYSPISRAAGPA